MYNRLNSTLDIFRKRNNVISEFTIYRENGEVLIQIFKQEVTINWDTPIELTDSNGLIINVAFNEDKTNNEENFMRFKNSRFSNLFKEYPKPNNITRVFFCGIHSSVQNEIVIDFILEMIKKIFNVDSFDFEVLEY